MYAPRHMDDLLGYIWWLSLIILTGYCLFVFRIRIRRPSGMSPDHFPSVSIVIAVKNGYDFLTQNLPVIVKQTYPEFEIILVDDHSDPEEAKKTEAMVFHLPGVFLFHSDRPPGKKNALALGIEKAKYDLILCTDADCRPAGPRWIEMMVAHQDNGSIVLGYSPHAEAPGILNAFIRFETIMTGMQYLSWGSLGRPYMGVGRNLLYPRALFQQVQQKQKGQSMPYGDDDLLVQAARSHSASRISLHPDTFVYTLPASSWGQWIKQKHRHMSAGRFYGWGSWWQPGMFGAALIFHWTLLTPLLLFSFNGWIMAAGCVGLLIRWWIYSRWAVQLWDTKAVKLYPVYEIGYTCYILLMGMMTLMKRKSTWN